MGNKIIFINISYNFFLLSAKFITSRCKKYTADLNFEKIANFASQLGSSGSDFRFHTQPIFCQNQNSLLEKCQNENTSPGLGRGRLVPSSFVLILLGNFYI